MQVPHRGALALRATALTIDSRLYQPSGGFCAALAQAAASATRKTLTAAPLPANAFSQAPSVVAAVRVVRRVQAWVPDRSAGLTE